MKHWYAQLALFLIMGLVLAGITFDLIRGLKDFGHSDILGALSLSGVGFGISLGATLILIIVMGFDAVWLLFFVVWVIKKKFHIKSDDNTLYLP